MLTITAQEIVKFTASARLDINPLEIHKKSQCCHLADTAREISNSEKDKEEEEKARKVQSESGVSRSTYIGYIQNSVYMCE